MINPISNELNPICHLMALLGANHIFQFSGLRVKNETDKILKYKDLTTEIQRMWNVKTKVIPVIIGATGTVSKSF